MKTAIPLPALALLWFSAGAAADPLPLQQHFDDISTLPGWLQLNQSAPVGQPWFQGNPGVFAAYDGAPDAYIAANYLSAAGGTGGVDNWLITPSLAMTGATSLDFYTRSAADAGYADHMEVLFSPTGGSAPGDFTTLLLTIGGGSYPAGWQHYSVMANGSGNGRFAFRYVGDAAQADYIGIDKVQVSPVPEPASAGMLAAGLLLLLRRRARLWLAAACAMLAMGAQAQEAASGSIVVRDPASGQLRAPSAAERKALTDLAAALQPATPATPRTTEVRPDGTRHRHLGEAGMIMTVVEKDAAGKLTIHCEEAGHAQR